MKKTIVLMLCLFFTTGLYAKYTHTCSVKYKTESRWSKYYNLDVVFLTGFEIFQATLKSGYDSSTVYAMIFFSQEKVAVVKIDSVLLCGTEVDKSCIEDSLLNLEGKDKSGREWEICKEDFCI
ncbi:MAG TPA: hypothetical protein PKG52_11875 [bacterium]|nr:hypothetical protein [bacterium]